MWNLQQSRCSFTVKNGEIKYDTIFNTDDDIKSILYYCNYAFAVTKDQSGWFYLFC